MSTPSLLVGDRAQVILDQRCVASGEFIGLGEDAIRLAKRGPQQLGRIGQCPLAFGPKLQRLAKRLFLDLAGSLAKQVPRLLQQTG